MAGFDPQAYAKGLSKDVESKKNFGKNSNNSNGNYTYKPRPRALILKKGVPSIIRPVGLPPHAEELSQGAVKAGPYDAFDFSYLTVMNASNPGKTAVLILPSQRRKRGKDRHPIVQMATEVLKESTVNGASVAVYSAKFPELYAFCKYGGFDVNSNQRYYHTFKPYEVTVFNCIDRRDNWCAENKHTKVVARGGSEDDNGDQKFVDFGVKSNPLDKALNRTLTYSPDWNSFDVAMTLTGDKDNPIIFDNVSVEKDSKSFYKTGLQEEDRELIHDEGPLTAEELSYQCYNLQEEFKPSTPKKVYDVCKDFVKMFDEAFNTNYLAELKAEADEYMAAVKAETARKTEEAAAEAATKIEAATQTAIETKSRVIEEEVEALEDVKIDTGVDLLPYAHLLKPEFRKAILNVKKEGDSFIGTYSSEDVFKQKAICDCGFKAPTAFNACPVCGSVFDE